jgi:hypothetical protein
VGLQRYFIILHIKVLPKGHPFVFAKIIYELNLCFKARWIFLFLHAFWLEMAKMGGNLDMVVGSHIYPLFFYLGYVIPRW